MHDILLFPLAQYWTFYVGFAAFVLAMLAIDLGVFHRQAHEVFAHLSGEMSQDFMAVIQSDPEHGPRQHG